MITADQIFLHLIGDYVLQSSWMACNKTSRSWPALVHAVAYSAPFLILSPSWEAWGFIFATHFLIDRFSSARWLCWAKDWLGPKQAPFREITPTGYPAGTPPHLADWLRIITDNTLHIGLNGFALAFL